MKFYPYEKGGGGGAEKVLAILKGGAQQVFWGKFYPVAWSFRHVKFYPYEKAGREKFYPVLKGWRKKFQTRDFPIL